MGEADKKELEVEEAIKNNKHLFEPPTKSDLLIKKLEKMKCPAHIYKNRTTKELTGVISFWKKEGKNYLAAKERKAKSLSLPIKLHPQFVKDLITHQDDEQATR